MVLLKGPSEAIQKYSAVFLFKPRLDTPTPFGSPTPQQKCAPSVFLPESYTTRFPGVLSEAASLSQGHHPAQVQGWAGSPRTREGRSLGREMRRGFHTGELSWVKELHLGRAGLPNGGGCTHLSHGVSHEGDNNGKHLRTVSTVSTICLFLPLLQMHKRSLVTVCQGHTER